MLPACVSPRGFSPCRLLANSSQTNVHSLASLQLGIRRRTSGRAKQIVTSEQGGPGLSALFRPNPIGHSANNKCCLLGNGAASPKVACALHECRLHHSNREPARDVELLLQVLPKAAYCKALLPIFWHCSSRTKQLQTKDFIRDKIHIQKITKDTHATL